MSEDRNTFLDYFSDLDDPRCEKNKLYPVEELLLLTLCAVLCGAEGWEDVEDFGQAKLSFLRRYLPYAHGTPSDDTVRRFFRALSPGAFQERFVSWASAFTQRSDKRHIALDGKTARGSRDGDKKALHLVSAFASEARIVLGQLKVDDKTNEIDALPELLSLLDLKGAIVSIDAMGCQYEIAKTIKEGGADYCLCLKGNQPTLFEDVSLYFEQPPFKAADQFNRASEADKGHGRIEQRTCTATGQIDWLIARHSNWTHLKSIVRMERTRDLDGQQTTETSYYLSSLAPDAKALLAAVRGHWGIENSLHWVLDMSFGEDQCRIRKQNAPQNMAILRHVALNLIRTVKPVRQSVKRYRKMAGWTDDILDSILLQKQ